MSLAPAAGGARVLVTATFVNTVGNGLYIAGGALFFTRGLGLPVGQVGIGLTVAGVVGLSGGLLLGQLADRYGARRMYFLLLSGQALAIAAFVLVGAFWSFVAVATVIAALEQGAIAARGALIARLAEGQPGGPARLRSYLRVVTNLGVSIGAALAGFAIAADDPSAYRILMLADGVSFVVAAVVVLGIPARPGSASSVPPPGRWQALRDRPYLVITGVNTVLSFEYDVLQFALPLWVVGHTRAPGWAVSPLLVANTLLVVLLQVRFSRGVDEPAGAARAIRRGGLALAAAAVIFGSSGQLTAATAVLALTIALVVHTYGELAHTAGSFGLSFDLAPANAHGQYQGVFGLSLGASQALAPLLLTWTCLNFGLPGWFLLGAVFLLAGQAAPTLTRWAHQSRANPLSTPLGEASTQVRPVPPR